MDDDEALARALQAEEAEYSAYNDYPDAAYYEDTYSPSTSKSCKRGRSAADSDFDEVDTDDDDDDWGAKKKNGAKKSGSAKKGKKPRAATARSSGKNVKAGSSSGGTTDTAASSNGIDGTVNANGSVGNDDVAAVEGNTSTSSSKPAKERAIQQSANGPWSTEEEKLFLEGLELYGRNWSQISTHLNNTRAPSNISSHAQMHFIKLCLQNIPLPASVLATGPGYTLAGGTSHIHPRKGAAIRHFRNVPKRLYSEAALREIEGYLR
ncbi:hypothetical protein HK097_007869, partial [Rhizophlyctis rosea]